VDDEYRTAGEGPAVPSAPVVTSSSISDGTFPNASHTEGADRMRVTLPLG
jgi:hypothetical protein